jgi:hypothetical protein
MRKNTILLLALSASVLCNTTALFSSPTDNPDYPPRQISQAADLIEKYSGDTNSQNLLDSEEINLPQKGQSLQVTIVNDPPSYPVREITFSDGFEDVTNWTANGCWQVGAQTWNGGPYAGDNVAATTLDGFHPNYAQDTLHSEMIDLSSFGSDMAINLKFWAMWQIENCCDGWHVVYTNDDLTWTMLYPSGGYPNASLGYTGSNLTWTQMDFCAFSAEDLPSQIRFGWVFHSDLSVVNPGVSLDEVSLNVIDPDNAEVSLTAMPDDDVCPDTWIDLWAALDLGGCFEPVNVDYTWDWGNGETQDYYGFSNNLTGSYSWADPGVYDVEISVTYNSNVYSEIVEITVVDVTPVLDLMPDITVCPLESLNLWASIDYGICPISSWVEFNWDFGNGDTYIGSGYTDLMSTNYAWESPGFYDVDFSVTVNEQLFEGSLVVEVEDLVAEISAMPDYPTWLDRDTKVWAAISFGECNTGNPEVTYTWNFGDGTIEEYTGYANFLVAEHAWATFGVKTCEITVDLDGSIYTAVTHVTVGPDLQDTRVAAAILDGLCWLYLNQQPDGSWDSGWSEEYKVGYTGMATLAFEENSFFPGDDFADNVFAPTINRGINYILEVSTRVDIDLETAGDPDVNENGSGVYFTHSAYGHGAGMLGLAASRLGDQIIAVGNPDVDGRYLYEVVQDGIDLIAWSQCDEANGTARGGWQYYVTSESYGNSDMSAVQWPILGVMSAQQNMGLSVPDWLAPETAYFVDYTQNLNVGSNDYGGWGYTYSTNWVNLAKTGAGIASNFFLSKAIEDTSNVLGFEYLANHWSDTFDGSSVNEHMNGNFYSMYGIKKAFEFYDVSINQGIDWYQDYVEYLLYNVSYGQSADGGWPYGTNWITSREGTTCIAILVLTRGVVSLQPVALISGPTSTPPDVDVAFDGTDSYHQDPEMNITSWLWDFDESDGIDWDNPDAIGESVIARGFYLHADSLEGNYTITLRVSDDSDSTMTDTDSFVLSVNRENHPPIADPGGPYFTRPGSMITLDASASYDPDPGDWIEAYEWDTDGDGVYDNGNTAQILWQAPDHEWNGLIGLRVFDHFGMSSDTLQPVNVTIWTSNVDVSSTFTFERPANPQIGTILPLCGVVTSVKEDESALDEVLVRFYYGDPRVSSEQVGSDTTLVNLEHGVGYEICVDWPINSLDGNSLWMVVDPEDDLFEYNENNNSEALPFGNLLCDFDNDWDVDFADFTVFIDAWNGANTTLGDISADPDTIVSFPPWSPDNYPVIPDGIVDGWDHLTMYVMYIWNKYLGIGGAQTASIPAAPRISFAQTLVVEDMISIPLNIETITPAGAILIELDFNESMFELMSAQTEDNLQVLHSHGKDGWMISIASLEGLIEDSQIILSLKGLQDGHGEFNLGEIHWVSPDGRIHNEITASSAIELEAIAIPDQFTLNPVYPNPFNPLTTISLTIPEAGRLVIDVYNLSGQLIEQINDSHTSRGQHKFSWNGASHSSGVYFISAKWGGRQEIVKAILVK